MIKFNDSKVHLVYGEKGSGKTTLSAVICKKYSQDLNVFSNYPLKGSSKITLDDLRTKRIPDGSIICIDEAAAEINCRDWRNTGTELLTFVQQIRHFEATAYIFTQSLNALDNQITELCDDAILCEKLFGLSIYTRARKIIKNNSRCIFELTNKKFFVIRKRYYDIFDTHYISELMKSRNMISIERW